MRDGEEGGAEGRKGGGREGRKGRREPSDAGSRLEILSKRGRQTIRGPAPKFSVPIAFSIIVSQHTFTYVRTRVSAVARESDPSNVTQNRLVPRVGDGDRTARTGEAEVRGDAPPPALSVLNRIARRRHASAVVRHMLGTIALSFFEHRALAVHGLDAAAAAQVLQRRHLERKLFPLALVIA